MSAPVTRLTSVIEFALQVDRRVGLADGFLVRPGHEAKGLAILQIHMRGVTKNAKLLGCLLERGELVKELLLSELLLREAAFVLVVGVDEVLSCRRSCCADCCFTLSSLLVVYMHDIGVAFTSCASFLFVLGCGNFDAITRRG